MNPLTSLVSPVNKRNFQAYLEADDAGDALVAERIIARLSAKRLMAKADRSVQTAHPERVVASLTTALLEARAYDAADHAAAALVSGRVVALCSA